MSTTTPTEAGPPEHAAGSRAERASGLAVLVKLRRRADVRLLSVDPSSRIALEGMRQLEAQ